MRAQLAWLVSVLLLPAAAPAAAETIRLEPGDSHVGYSLRTRWGQQLDGRFPAFEGGVQVLADARRQVRLVLDAREVEIVGNARHTRITRGEGFFDAQHHPQVRFESEPFDAALMAEGGEVAGVLEIRGVRRVERFHVAPAGCARPLLDCAVDVTGTVSRGDYAMDRWGVALSDRVQFRLHLRGSQAVAP